MAENGAPLALRAQNIVKRFGAVTALEGVSLQLAEGEILGILGDNGAGKSTLIKILTGFHQQTSGELEIHGEETLLRSVDHARSLGIEAQRAKTVKETTDLIAKALKDGTALLIDVDMERNYKPM